ncbi:MAG: hypothetical protein HYV40_00265 [Candidatus Levybacteria bacterium]|nr:hypothetical protein [Candidatus Levybacteria bacterium]
MAEAYRPTPQSIIDVAGRASFPIVEAEIDEVFPVYKLNSWVFRAGAVVYKIRLATTEEQKIASAREARNFQSLLSFYRMKGVDFGRSEGLTGDGYTLLRMPYLGISLHVIGQQLDLVKLGYNSAALSNIEDRFSPERLCHLVEQFKRDQAEFASVFGLVHCDLAQNNAPNNIVYNEPLDRLIPIDAEAFREYDPEASQTFRDQVAAVKTWSLA